jgi:hypothetical protein
MNGLYTFAAILIGILLFVWLISLKPRGRKVTYRNDVSWTPPQPFQPTPAIMTPHAEYHSMTVGVVVPIAQAFVTAFCLALVALSVALLAGAGIKSLEWAGVVFTVVLAGVWLLRQRAWNNAVRRLESVLGVDLNGDGIVNEEPPRVAVDMNYRAPDGGLERQSRRNYTATPEQMHDLAVGILNRNQPFSEDVWAGAGKPFSQNQLRELRRQFEADGLVQPKGKGNTGFEFTPDGRALLAAFADSPPQGHA